MWNYVSNRWVPTNPVGKFAFETAILVIFVVIPAVVLELASS